MNRVGAIPSTTTMNNIFIIPTAIGKPVKMYFEGKPIEHNSAEYIDAFNKLLENIGKYNMTNFNYEEMLCENIDDHIEWLRSVDYTINWQTRINQLEWDIHELIRIVKEQGETNKWSKKSE